MEANWDPTGGLVTIETFGGRLTLTGLGNAPREFYCVSGPITDIVLTIHDNRPADIRPDFWCGWCFFIPIAEVMWGWPEVSNEEIATRLLWGLLRETTSPLLEDRGFQNLASKIKALAEGDLKGIVDLWQPETDDEFLGITACGNIARAAAQLIRGDVRDAGFSLACAVVCVLGIDDTQAHSSILNLLEEESRRMEILKIPPVERSAQNSPEL